MSKPGYEWDTLNRRWKPVNYLDMTTEQLKARRDAADDRLAEVDAQVRSLLPVAEAQTLLNKSMDELQDLMIDLAKKAPKVLLKAVTGA